MWSYAPNVRASEDIRILPIQPGQWPDLPHQDYWLFDSRDLWIMAYDADGRFVCAELVPDPAEVVRHATGAAPRFIKPSHTRST
jgi:hypothetical protein